MPEVPVHCYTPVTIYPRRFPACLYKALRCRTVDGNVSEGPCSGHGLLPRQPVVFGGVHVDDLLCFHHHGWRLVFEPPLALERNTQLVQHRAAEGPLWRDREEERASEGGRPLYRSRYYGEGKLNVESRIRRC